MNFFIADINNKGEIVGYGSGRDTPQGAFLWRKGRFTELGARMGQGQVIGLSIHEERGHNYFVWERGDVALLEPSVPDGLAIPSQLNDLGQIVGVTGTSNTGESRPALWQDGTVMELGMPEGAIDAGAQDIHNRGQVVVIATFTDPFHLVPYIWEEGEVLTLPLVSSDQDNGRVLRINERGVAVGVTWTEGVGGGTPTVWRQGQAQDLNDLIWDKDPLQPYVHLDGALLINDRGYIVATGIDSRDAPLGSYYLLVPKSKRSSGQK